MKKRSLKALKLTKKSISALTNVKNVQGGRGGSLIGVCDTEYFCDTWASCDPIKLSDFCDPRKP
ncbi:hypothetical protein [Kordia sp.]|uniref:hypothetical protein n=1 Tax=Kordia sp. TaxID=1965332 RepID=UPI003B5A8F29